MKKTGIIFYFLICLSFSGFAQEIPAVEDGASELFVKRLEIRPSLSNLAPEVPVSGKFRVRSVNFDDMHKHELKEINMIAIMEQDGRMQSRTVDIAPPVRVRQPDNNTINLSGNEDLSTRPRFFNQSFSPEMPVRGTRNSVYQNAAESTGAYYLNGYSPFYNRGYRGNRHYYY